MFTALHGLHRPDRVRGSSVHDAARLDLDETRSCRKAYMTACHAGGMPGFWAVTVPAGKELHSSALLTKLPLERGLFIHRCFSTHTEGPSIRT